MGYHTPNNDDYTRYTQMFYDLLHASYILAYIPDVLQKTYGWRLF
jgi:hypothetical protein